MTRIITVGMLFVALLTSSSMSLSRATLVLLVGPACAGKSTLMKKIIEIDPSIKIGYDQDYSYHKEARDFIAHEFKDEYYVLSQAIAHDNIFHALKYNEVVFKKNIDAALQERVIKLLKKIRNTLDNPNNNLSKKCKADYREHLEKTLHSYATTNDCYLIDSWIATMSPSMLSELRKRYNVIVICVYTSLAESVQRLQARNTRGLIEDNLSNNRFYRYVIDGIKYAYRITVNEKNAIDILERDKVVELFDAIIPLLAQEPKFPSYAAFSNGDYTREELMDLKEAFLKEFNLVEHNSVSICPNYSYDYVINSSGKTAEELARDVLAIIQRDELKMLSPMVNKD